MKEKLNRETFITNRSLEFFSEKELSMQIGHSRQLWPAAILKELVDNALDACETARIWPLPPLIERSVRIASGPCGSGFHRRLC